MAELGHRALNACNPVQDEDFPICILDVRDGVSTPPRLGFQIAHWHEDLQYVCVRQGAAQITTVEGSFACTAGHAVLFNTETVHRIMSGPGDAYTSFIFPARVLGFSGEPQLSLSCVDGHIGAGMPPVMHFDGGEGWHAELLAHLFRAAKAAGSAGDEDIRHYRINAELAGA